MIQNSYELLSILKKIGYLKSERDPLWWPHSGTVEVVLGALLTQQTKWEKVESSLSNLHSAGLDTLESIASTDMEEIASLIKPSGFYNTKAERMTALCRKIIDDFVSFENFQEQVDRDWLLAQRGIGPESADSILCYACKRDAFVVDSYTGRLLDALGYRFEQYEEIQEWMVSGLEANLDKVYRLYGEALPRYQIYARMHGKIVEFAKDNIRGRQVNLQPFQE